MKKLLKRNLRIMFWLAEMSKEGKPTYYLHFKGRKITEVASDDVQECMKRAKRRSDALFCLN